MGVSQKLPVGSFEWKRTCLELMKNSYRTMNKTGRADTQLSFLLKRMKINKCGQENYIIHLRVLKQTMNHELMLEKINRVINFNQEIWLKPYIDMNTVNTELRTKTKNDFEKDFFKLMNSSVFGKPMENANKCWSFRFVPTDRRSCLVAEPNYHTTK